MRTTCLVALLSFASAATAQSWYVPDNLAASGSCNVIPFGATSIATWGNQRYMSKATVADLGAVAGVVTGLGFAPCGTGNIHFDSLEITLDHHPAGTPLDPTFANNLSPNAVTVFSATNFDWNITQSAWNDIGLQNVFVFNGVDDVVMQIATVNAITTGTQGFHRDVRQRLYSTTSSTSATGTLGNAAMKFEVSMMMGKLSTYGRGCPGTNGVPSVALSGLPNPGQQVDITLANGLPNGFAFQVYGFYRGIPYPLDLAIYGMAGCFQYTDAAAIGLVLLGGTGGVQVPFTIPNSPGMIGLTVYNQFACIDPSANSTGVTTTNYGRIYIGN